MRRTKYTIQHPRRDDHENPDDPVARSGEYERHDSSFVVCTLNVTLEPDGKRVSITGLRRPRARGRLGSRPPSQLRVGACAHQAPPKFRKRVSAPLD